MYDKNKRIFLSPPTMSGDEFKLLKHTFDSNWIAPTGEQIDLFENELSNYIGVKSSCAVSSGTAALHLALRLLKVSKGDYVICPSLTFAATANAILYENATPVFIDSDSRCWTLSVDLLEKAIKKYKPKALITVDIYGQACDYDRIAELCDKYNVSIIEDAAEALGSSYKHKKLGSFGAIGVISFNGNKIITTSSGGMIVSNDENLIDKAKFLSNQAREPVLHYEHKELGFNYRMSNLLAAVGRGQLKNLNTFVTKRRTIYKIYQEYLSGYDGLDFMDEPDYSFGNRWLTTLIVNKKRTFFHRNDIIQILSEHNIESRPVWKPMHMQPLYRDCIYVSDKQEDVSAKLFENGICLPSGSNLLEEDQLRIINIIKKLF